LRIAKKVSVDVLMVNTKEVLPETDWGVVGVAVVVVVGGGGGVAVGGSGGCSRLGVGSCCVVVKAKVAAFGISRGLKGLPSVKHSISTRHSSWRSPTLNPPESGAPSLTELQVQTVKTLVLIA
jgi:hypothetical protein